MSAPTYGELGTYAGGYVVDPDSFRLVSPKRRAGGVIVAVFPKAAGVVTVADEKSGDDVTIRLGGRR